MGLGPLGTGQPLGRDPGAGLASPICSAHSCPAEQLTRAGTKTRTRLLEMTPNNNAAAAAVSRILSFFVITTTAVIHILFLYLLLCYSTEFNLPVNIVLCYVGFSLYS